MKLRLRLYAYSSCLCREPYHLAHKTDGETRKFNASEREATRYRHLHSSILVRYLVISERLSSKLQTIVGEYLLEAFSQLCMKLLPLITIGQSLFLEYHKRYRVLIYVSSFDILLGTTSKEISCGHKTIFVSARRLCSFNWLPRILPKYPCSPRL